MVDATKRGPKTRRDLTIFYILDTSGSMEGAPIQMLNEAMGNTISALKGLNTEDCHVKIAVLEYSSSAHWLNPVAPEYIEDFVWEDRLQAGGLTNVPAALDELDAKMSADEFLKTDNGAFMPVVIFMSDGWINDQFQLTYEQALARIRDNKWFKNATKVGFALGDDADEDMVAEVVGGKESMCKCDSLAYFSEMIEKVSVTSTMLNAKTHMNNVSGGNVLDEVRRDKEEPPAPEPGPEPSPEPGPESTSDPWDSETGWASEGSW